MSEIDKLAAEGNAGGAKKENETDAAKKRSMILADAVATFLYLIQTAERMSGSSSCKQFRRRNVRLEKIDLFDPSHFGPIAELGSNWMETDESERIGIENGERWKLRDSKNAIAREELVDLKQLKEYISAEKARRPDEVRDFPQRVENGGREFAGGSGVAMRALSIQFRQKIAGRRNGIKNEMGRHYAAGPSIRRLTREAGQAAISSNVGIRDFSIQNARIQACRELCARYGLQRKY